MRIRYIIVLTFLGHSGVLPQTILQRSLNTVKNFYYSEEHTQARQLMAAGLAAMGICGGTVSVWYLLKPQPKHLDNEQEIIKEVNFRLNQFSAIEGIRQEGMTISVYLSHLDVMSLHTFERNQEIIAEVIQHYCPEVRKIEIQVNNKSWGIWDYEMGLKEEVI